MKNKNSLYIHLYEDFLFSYKSYKTKQNANSLAKCLGLLQPCFLSWQEDFFLKDFNQNINILTLFSLLSKDDKPKAPLSWKVNKYKEYLIENNLKFIDHLNEAFLIHMAKDTVLYQNYPKPYRFIFYISQEIKYALFKIIRKILQSTKRDYFTNPSYNPKTFISEPEEKLSLEFYFLFQNNKLLYSIIISLLYEDNTWKNVKKKFNLNNKKYTLIKEEANTWISIVLSNS